MVFEVISVVALVLAVSVAVAQFVTHHRPFVCVDDLRREMYEPGAYLLVVVITNLGQVPAKRARISVEQMTGDPRGSDVLKTDTRPLGAIFPGQRLRANFGLNDEVDQWINSGPGGFISVNLEYRGPLSFGVGRVAFGRYSTYQPLYLDRDDWGAALGEEADFR